MPHRAGPDPAMACLTEPDPCLPDQTLPGPTLTSLTEPHLATPYPAMPKPTRPNRDLPLVVQDFELNDIESSIRRPEISDSNQPSSLLQDVV